MKRTRVVMMSAKELILCRFGFSLRPRTLSKIADWAPGAHCIAHRGWRNLRDGDSSAAMTGKERGRSSRRHDREAEQRRAFCHPRIVGHNRRQLRRDERGRGKVYRIQGAHLHRVQHAGGVE